MSAAVSSRADRLLALCDHVYRGWHRLDRPLSRIPPLLSLHVARSWRSHRLPDGTVLRAGARYGELHLDNAGVLELRARARSPEQLGLALRRALRASLVALAAASSPGGRFAHVVAFSAITIFHPSLARLGFQVEPRGLFAPRITGAYHHALLHSFGARPAEHRSLRAARLWVTRRRLRALYGPLWRIS